jgi:Fe-S-cluster containining protein
MRITAFLDNALRQHGNIEELTKYYSYRGIRVMGVDKKNNRLFFEMDNPCDKLTPENKCSVHGDHERRPLICERYPRFQDNIETCGYGFK